MLHGRVVYHAIGWSTVWHDLLQSNTTSFRYKFQKCGYMHRWCRCNYISKDCVQRPCPKSLQCNCLRKNSNPDSKLSTTGRLNNQSLCSIVPHGSLSYNTLWQWQSIVQHSVTMAVYGTTLLLHDWCSIVQHDDLLCDMVVYHTTW